MALPCILPTFFLRAAALALALGCAVPARAATDPPVAPVRNVPETFHGTVVDDPYRYFENKDDPEVAAWMKAHSDHARKVLDSIGGRDELRRKIEAYDASAPARVGGVSRLPDGTLFYLRLGASENQFKLYVRGPGAGAERLLFDPEPLQRDGGQPHAINYFEPSPNGRYVALGVSAGGSEDASMRVLEVASGRQVGPEIPRARFGAVSWAPDSTQIFFHRTQALGAGAPPTDTFKRSVAVVMPVGGGEDSVRVLLRAGEDLGIPETEFPFVSVDEEGHAVATVFDGVSPDFAAWHTTMAALLAGRPDWKPLATREDDVTALAIVNEQVYALTFAGAPRFKLVGGPLKGFSVARARVLVPESRDVITGMTAAADGLYLGVRQGNVLRLDKLAYRPGARPVTVPLPVAGSFEFTGTGPGPRQPGVMLSLQGWTQARQIVAVAPDGRVADTGLQPAGPYDRPTDVEATEVMVRSHDGTMVPMSIIHKKGIKLDGRNPTILYGYASYGITEEPWFSTSRLAWMEAGGVFAVANPRGSGVFGREWHLAGKGIRKPNTWKDFIACAEYLVGQGWTRPDRLGIWGGSAGGILVGRAMTDRPDLFAVVVPSVGALDGVRFETTPNGVPNIPEFGSVKTEEGFRGLLAMSTYHAVRDGVSYPAVLLTHGVNDPRVEVWMSTKAAARLMAATSSKRPVLLRLDYTSGHGVGNTKAQVLDEVADVYAFMLWQFGMPGYAPAATP